MVVQGFGLLDLCVSLCVVTLRRESLATLDCWNAMEAVMGAINAFDGQDRFHIPRPSVLIGRTVLGVPLRVARLSAPGVQGVLLLMERIYGLEYPRL